MINAADIDWNEVDENAWKKYCELKYYEKNRTNEPLEKELETFKVETIYSWTGETFYEFLYNKYFIWKYTASNRLATTRSKLSELSLEETSLILEYLICFEKRIDYSDYNDALIKAGFKLITMIPGLGIAGASGLLSILFPDYYGTVDQFVVKSLERLGVLTDVKDPENISMDEAVRIERIMHDKALEMNRVFATDYWNSRKIDKVLWTLRF